MSGWTSSHRLIGIATCAYGLCSRVLRAPCYVRLGSAYCSEQCALADQTLPSPFYRRLAGQL